MTTFNGVTIVPGGQTPRGPNDGTGVYPSGGQTPRGPDDGTGLSPPSKTGTYVAEKKEKKERPCQGACKLAKIIGFTGLVFVGDLYGGPAGGAAAGESFNNAFEYLHSIGSDDR